MLHHLYWMGKESQQCWGINILFVYVFTYFLQIRGVSDILMIKYIQINLKLPFIWKLYGHLHPPQLHPEVQGRGQWMSRSQTWPGRVGRSPGGCTTGQQQFCTCSNSREVYIHCIFQCRRCSALAAISCIALLHSCLTLSPCSALFCSCPLSFSFFWANLS